jgi:hypothetical protein
MEKEDFPEWDLSPYNTTTDWRRIESVYGLLREDYEVFMISAFLIISCSVPLHLFLIIQILRSVFSSKVNTSTIYKY